MSGFLFVTAAAQVLCLSYYAIHAPSPTAGLPGTVPLHKADSAGLPYVAESPKPAHHGPAHHGPGAVVESPRDHKHSDQPKAQKKSADSALANPPVQPDPPAHAHEDPATQDSDKCQMKLFRGNRQKGLDLENHLVKTSEQCGDMCAAHPQCAAATYQKAATMCWMHTHAVKVQAAPGMDFWEKRCPNGLPPALAGAGAVPAPVLSQDAPPEPEEEREEEEEEEADVAEGSEDPSGLLWPKTPATLQRLRHAAAVVLTYNRPEYLQKTMETLLKARHAQALALYISQDGSDPNVAAMAGRFREAKHLQKPHTASGPAKASPTVYVAAHYKWVLDRLFLTHNHSHVILLEDDMLVSPDVFSYFEQTAALLDADPTVWCVSTWNDNGHAHLDLPSKTLFRNSYFPGLGWMLKQSLWRELSPKFPADHWDHWMRSASQHKGRDCVCPYLSRNYNIGEHGATLKTGDYNRFLKHIKYNKKRRVALGDLNYLLSSNYHDRLVQDLKDGQVVSLPLTPYLSTSSSSPLILPYKREDYPKVAAALQLMNSVRGHYAYITVVFYKGHKLLLVDRRLSPLASQKPGVQLKPNSELLIVKATAADQSCTAVCEAKSGYRCDSKQFDFVNDCAALQRYFSCASCNRDMGKDIPNMVMDPKDKNYGHCLVTEDFPTCSAHHAATVRLCPCVTD